LTTDSSALKVASTGPEPVPPASLSPVSGEVVLSMVFFFAAIYYAKLSAPSRQLR